MRKAIGYCFSHSKIEIFFLRDCQFGFQGEVKMVKPGFAMKALIPQTLALQNQPGFRRRLLPDIDEEELKQKISRRQQVRLFHQKIAGVYVDFVRVPKFSNPNLMKEAIDEQTIISEVKDRFKLIISKNNLLSMTNKITTYGQFVLQVENYYSEELGDYTTFPITIICRKPIQKMQKLIDEVDPNAVIPKKQGENDEENKNDKETAAKSE